MTISSIKLKNFAGFDQIECSFNDNITYLIGKNGAGKSGIGINAIWFMFQGIMEKSTPTINPLIGERYLFIGPKGKAAEGEMVLKDEKLNRTITVSRKQTKDNTSVSFQTDDGSFLDQTFLNDLFNIFLIAPKKFLELTPKQQATELGIDTSDFDTRINLVKEECSDINKEIKAIGVLVPKDAIQVVKVEELNKQKNELIELNRLETVKQHTLENQRKVIENSEKLAKEISDQIDALKIRHQTGLDFIKKEKEKLSKLPQSVPATVLEINNKISMLDVQLNEATKINVRANEYQNYLKDKEKVAKKKAELEEKRKLQEKITQERINYLQTQKLPDPLLTINEEGELNFSNRPLKPQYFSTGELIKIIPILMSVKNPELKYVFIQDFNLLDEDGQKQLVAYLTKKGFQLVIEVVGTKAIADKTCLVLKDRKLVIEEGEING